MASTIKLEVVTPERPVFDEEIRMVVAPAIDGDIGILPGHTPLVTGLEIGVLKVEKEGEETRYISISEGFMEVQPEQINVVVRTAELEEEIDVERAKSAKERAKDRLERAHQERIDAARARAALERAASRINAANYKRRG